MLFCFKLPLGYFKCEEITLQREGKRIYLHFLGNVFFATKSEHKNFYAIVPEEWEKFINTVKERLKDLTNQVLWSYAVNPKWVYGTLNALKFLKEDLKEGYLILSVASNPYRSPFGVLNLKTGTLKVKLLPLESLWGYLLTDLEWKMGVKDICGRISLIYRLKGKVKSKILLDVFLKENPDIDVPLGEEETFWEILTPKTFYRANEIFLKRLEELLNSYKLVLNSYYRNREFRDYLDNLRGYFETLK